MSEEILPGLHKIEIPLPGSPLKALNSYLIKGEGRFLLIDTGWNREECVRKMHSELQALDVDLKKTDIFITHLHADHSGMAPVLATGTSAIYFNGPEASLFTRYKKEERDRKLAEIYVANGFPEEQVKNLAWSLPGRKYGLRDPLNFRILKEGDHLQIGDYSFDCIETPGHSPGHMCLYEPGKKILMAGDHILFDITPNIMFWFSMQDSLKQYLASLDKVYPLDVNLVLPGHRSIVSNHRKRITELREHHRDRLNEVLAALADGGKNVFEVAPRITWDISYKSWELFPFGQKWFAFGEALSHLRYLEEQGKVRETARDGKILFSLT